MKYLLVVLAGLMLVPIISLATVHHVNMQDFYFDPDTVNANEGDTVQWVNHGSVEHTTTSGIGGVFDGYWDSGLLPPMGQFTFVFDSIGTFPYFCRPHWAIGMVGVIFVNPVGIEETESGLPQRFQVNQNYPNPFKSSTRITYELDAPAMTEIKIYNASGQFVKKLTEQYMISGKYSVMWNGENSRGEKVPSGIYIYQLKIDNETISKQMLILR